jgi:tetratricopeptide (TPR) repeat protein
MSRLLLRIEEELRTEASAVRRAELLAKGAGYLARVGRFDEAKRLVAELRQDFGDGHSGRTTVWIMLAEGLLQLFEDFNPGALDRIVRAQFLAQAIGDRQLNALSSAWRAHFEFETSKFDAMVQSLSKAIACAHAEDHDAHARLSMVLCNAFLLCGDRVRAQVWFSRSRDHALSDGDQASVEALLYNRAAFGMAWLRAQRCFGHVSDSEVSLVRLDVTSAMHLQELTRVAALTNFVHLCNARLLILEGKYELAIERLEGIRNARPFADYNFNQSFVDLELAFCLFRLGRLDDSLDLYNTRANATYAEMDIDEQLVAYWMQFEMSNSDGRYGDLDEARRNLDGVSNEYLRLTAQFRQLLEAFHGA